MFCDREVNVNMKQRIGWEAEIKADNRIVEQWLLWVNERKQILLSARMDILKSYGSGLINAGMGRKNIVADPTSL